MQSDAMAALPTTVPCVSHLVIVTCVVGRSMIGRYLLRRGHFPAKDHLVSELVSSQLVKRLAGNWSVGGIGGWVAHTCAIR
jgi:hypothetical protein